MVDLHATTVPYDPAELRRSSTTPRRCCMASGLDPERCVLFRQGDVREHTELTWLLSSVTAHGDLNRMTQFKDKSAQQRELVSAGLFLYPVLQAADVLAYRAEEVPVGDDQRQHIELMRDIAERFNATYGEGLGVPEHRIPRSARGSWTSRTRLRRCRTTALGGARADLHRRGGEADRQEDQERSHRFGFPRSGGVRARPASRT